MTTPGTATRIALFAAIAVACAGCTPEPGHVSEGDVLVVDVFSGRENPQMTLSADDAEAINAAIEACGEFTANPPVRTPALGFRGFAIQTDVELVVVSADGVWLTDDDGTSLCEGTAPFDEVLEVVKVHVDDIATLIAPY